MNKRNLILAAAILLVASAAFAAQPAKSSLSLPITGSFTDTLGGKGTFNGTFQLVDFSATATQVMANGFLSGVLTDSTGAPIGSVMKSVSLPTSFSTVSAARTRASSMSVSASSTCDVLYLTLGPLHLDLLGLTVDLNQVVLDIAAQTGAGNLLGNLLCAVTNLLNGAGSLVDIANLLNQILQVLTGFLG